jgi:hypothetical protein
MQVADNGGGKMPSLEAFASVQPESSVTFGMRGRMNHEWTRKDTNGSGLGVAAAARRGSYQVSDGRRLIRLQRI